MTTTGTTSATAAGTEVQASAEACCSTSALQTCCAPEDKGACCGTLAGIATDAPAQAPGSCGCR
ncbi:hypothetical protein ACFOWE_25625 [Planomonospora corallina]|uniref:Uncharacterized protein n=1 Tax=Planomonospora corallina TaxID=1806052 RepID=A0ABV8IIS7_9ACTN